MTTWGASRDCRWLDDTIFIYALIKQATRDYRRDGPPVSCITQSAFGVASGDAFGFGCFGNLGLLGGDFGGASASVEGLGGPPLALDSCFRELSRSISFTYAKATALHADGINGANGRPKAVIWPGFTANSWLGGSSKSERM